jgi:hypothetical protein
MNHTSKMLREIAADYIHLAQDADGNTDSLRRRRYEWLLRRTDQKLSLAKRQAGAGSTKRRKDDVKEVIP